MEPHSEREKDLAWTNADAKENQKLVLSDFLSQIVTNHRESIQRVFMRSSSGVVLGVITGVGRAVYYEKALLPELMRSVSRLTLVSFHFFALKEVCDRLKGRETIWSTFFAGGFSGWFYGLLRFRETVSPTRSFIAGVCASSIGLLVVGGLESARDHIVFRWEQGAETEREFYLFRLYHHLIGEDKELERLRAKRDALYLELFQLQDEKKKNESKM
ncbi:hypothetical protein Gasu2_24000 [Galdieria sulphuraria]|uniref:Uncharacterized protein n=1 Tax=Galdieria sulphuraria TaxID=130081 RepID=M2Y9G9_GALSU|nr:uncharacterized protein Gasu_02890 [Galdieria sulphuraria]EME32514.1 hypothetical protein Gasu_02890 [Galdieria sulphuraria]GJD08089.1 hypothetical protein Gasu2_24000 [Galdieria sulphuraria]|eukprot:XP_005709034.1 hypothetical protein Gasu_02890 [Galdieria sulphuraria]